MTKNPTSNFGAVLERLLYYPGCDPKTLFGHKSVWMSTAYGFIHSAVLTVFFLLFTPQLTILIHYGYSLIVMFAITLTLFLVFPRQFMITGPLQGWTFNLITFFYIIKLGGIPTSGGLIFVGITTALATIPLQIVWYSVMMFLVYIVLVVLMVALKPWMTVPEQMTPALNSLVYMINTMSMTGASFYFVLNFFKQQRRIDDMEASRLKEINEVKSRLFTNITHEFRTPLTVIEGMSELIEKKPEEWLKEGTTKIRNNSRVLLKLVNQMLDMAKIESGVMSLNYIQSDICTYTGYVTELFASVAQTRGIILTCKTAPQPFIMDFDPDKLMQIISNLVSNALKFTGEGGRVEVSGHPDEKGTRFIVKVSDTGTGISPEHLPHIFERFYQADNVAGFNQGTGLGLAYARELVSLHSGEIMAESHQGTGTVLTVSLPITNTAPVVDFAETVTDRKETGIILTGTAEPESSFGEIQVSESELPLMLIVEDSQDVSRYLAAILKDEYRIEQAGNGKQGLDKAVSFIPDIILSDVMMPEMDGIELLEKVKNDIRTSHIPVVMLTAKADIISRLEGLEKGADAYLAKPFDEKELHIVLKNLLGIRRKMQERYSTMAAQPESNGNEYRLEDAFMKRVRQALETNLADDEFGISELCTELGVSRAQLYRKFSSLSNKTLAVYLKELRFNKAKILLSTTSMNITEVALVTGFKSLSYFSREFSSEFGIPPLEFRRLCSQKPAGSRSLFPGLLIAIIILCVSCKGEINIRGRSMDSLGSVDSSATEVEVADEFQSVNALLVLPKNPAPGVNFRILATGGKQLRKAQIRVSGPSGDLKSLQSITGDELPCWRIDDFAGAPEGEYSVTLIEKNREVTNLVFVISPGADKRMTGLVWKTERGWDSNAEALYSAWINALFSGYGEDASWSSLNEVTQNREKNFLYNHLTLGEDDPEAKVRVIMQPDCADNPFFLRAYFAWKLGLPFGYHVCDRGYLGKNPGTGQWITNETPAAKSDPVMSFNSFLRKVMDGVHSGTARTSMDDPDSDYYPVPLDRKSLIPGTVFADPYGHTMILCSWIPQTGSLPGKLLSVDAQPDGTVAIKRFWKGNFLFNTSEVIGEPGFKAFRPIILQDGAPRLVPYNSLNASSGFIPYSLQQRKMETEVFYQTMERLINPEPLDPESALEDLINSLHEQLLVRVTSVANSESYLKAHPGTVIPMPSGVAGVFLAGGLWEAYSTPNRDLRLLIAMDAVLGFPERVVSLPELFDIPGTVSPDRIKQELQAVMDKKGAELSIRYLRTDGTEQMLTVSEILSRRESFEMAYNPNDGIEIRWGAPTGSEEMAACRRRAPAGQYEKMRAVRPWFQKRLHPPT